MPLATRGNLSRTCPKTLAAIDLNGLGDTGGLFSTAGAVSEAERLMAEAYGAPNCAFLTGGANAGLLTALQLAAPREGKSWWIAAALRGYSTRWP